MQYIHNIIRIYSSYIPLGCGGYDLKLSLFAIVAWSLWVCRNKMAIEKKFSSSVIDIMYKSDFLYDLCQLYIIQNSKKLLCFPNKLYIIQNFTK